MGYFIDQNGQYYEGDRSSPADTEVTARPSGALSTFSQTITLPTGGTVTLASQSLPVPYTWDGSAWVADLAALRLTRLALIREHRKTLYDSCNLATIRGNNTNNRGLKRQAGEWNTKLDNVPGLATTALDALTTAADIAAYTPDYEPPAYVYVVSAVQFFRTLQNSNYLTEEQARERNTYPTNLANAFNSLPDGGEDARTTWKNFTEVAEDDALVPLVSAALGVAPEDVHAFFVAAFAVV